MTPLNDPEEPFKLPKELEVDRQSPGHVVHHEPHPEESDDDEAAEESFESDGDWVWCNVFNALQLSAPLPVAMSVASAAKRWVETRNPNFLDVALLQCEAVGAPIPGVLCNLLADAARSRIEETTRAGTPRKVRRDILLDHCFRLIANLRAAGATLDEATSKAARAFPALGVKASSLQKWYPASSWPERESQLAKVHLDADYAEIWAQLRKDLPDASEDMKGTRR